MLRNLFNNDDRGQAYTIEAVLAVLLLFSVILFIAPSFATPSDKDSVTDARDDELVKQDVHAMLERHAANGELKAAILNYNDGNAEWDNGFVQPEEGYYVRPPNGPLGDSIREIEGKHNVTISIYLIPESNASATPPERYNPDRITFLRQSSSVNNIGSESVTLTFYDEDHLRSDADVHTRHGTALRQYLGDGDAIKDTSQFPLPEAADRNGGDPETVWNTVTVRVVIDRAEI